SNSPAAATAQNRCSAHTPESWQRSATLPPAYRPESAQSPHREADHCPDPHTSCLTQSAAHSPTSHSPPPAPTEPAHCGERPLCRSARCTERPPWRSAALPGDSHHQQSTHISTLPQPPPCE